MKTNKKEKCFCANCEKYVDYRIKESALQANLKNKLYKYKGKVAICKNCNNLLFLPKINDENLVSLYRQYRKDNNIVMQEVVVDLPKKYNIGKRPLSRLLNWGELTYSRFINGSIPNKKYSDIIMKLYNDPMYFDEILDKNKSNIENITYVKCKKAINKILNINTNKINDIADYILYKSNNDITNLAMQKLLYYVQGFYYAFYGKMIFLDDCEAWVHGPVYEKLYQKYKKSGYKPIAKCKEFDSSKLNKKELVIINEVINNFGCFSGKYLEELTHLEKPWKDARKGLKSNENSKRTINKEAINIFFCELLKKYDITCPKEIYKYSFAKLLSKN